MVSAYPTSYRGAARPSRGGFQGRAAKPAAPALPSRPRPANDNRPPPANDNKPARGSHLPRVPAPARNWHKGLKPGAFWAVEYIAGLLQEQLRDFYLARAERDEGISATGFQLHSKCGSYPPYFPLTHIYRANTGVTNACQVTLPWPATTPSHRPINTTVPAAWTGFWTCRRNNPTLDGLLGIYMRTAELWHRVQAGEQTVTYLPAQTPRYIPAHWPSVAPVVDPLSIPIGVPAPTPSPLPYRAIPGRRPNPDRVEQREVGYAPTPAPQPITRPRPDPAPVPQPVAPRRPPGPGVKERKMRMGPAARAVMAGFGHVTEAIDTLDCLYSSLPPTERYGYYKRYGRTRQFKEYRASVTKKAQIVYEKFDKIDIDQWIECAQKELVQDRVIGYTGRGSRGASKVIRPWSPFGPTIGPAL